MLKINIPIYDGEVLIALKLEDYDSGYVKKWLKSNYKKDTVGAYEAFKVIEDGWQDVKDGNSRGVTVGKGKLYTVICYDYNSPSRIGTLIHELTHVVIDILDYSGLTLSRDSEEAYTYLVGWLTEQVFKHIDKLKDEN